MSHQQLAEALNRSVDGVKRRLVALNLREERSETQFHQGRGWGAEEEQRLLELAGTMSYREIAVIPDRPVKGVASRLAKLRWESRLEIIVMQCNFVRCSIMRNLSPAFVLLLLALTALSCGVVGSDDPPPRPVAEFDVGCLRLADSVVTFTNTSADASEFRWEFGDGRTATARDTSIVYGDSGTYRVRLIVRNSSGADTAERSIVIYPDIPAKKILDVPFRKEEAPSWSWVAACDMVLRYYGIEKEQCRIVEESYAAQCCDNPERCDLTWTSDRIRIALERQGELNSETQQVLMTMEQIRLEIAQGRPIIASVENASSTYAFILVIYGYDEFGRIYIHDPGFGSTVHSYDYTLRDYSSPDYEWSKTIFCVRR